MKEELEQVNKDIKDLESRIKILEQRKKSIESKLSCPDLEGKCIFIKDELNQKYIKVDKISKVEDGVNFVTGFTISISMFAIKIIYRIENESLTYLPLDYKIITEEEFNNELINVIKKLCNKVNTIILNNE